MGIIENCSWGDDSLKFAVKITLEMTTKLGNKMVSVLHIQYKKRRLIQMTILQYLINPDNSKNIEDQGTDIIEV